MLLCLHNCGECDGVILMQVVNELDTVVSLDVDVLEQCDDGVLTSLPPFLSCVKLG